MRKILFSFFVALILPSIAHAGIFDLFTKSQPKVKEDSSLMLGDINIRPLDQFTSTTSPSDAITQRTYGKPIRLTGVNTSGETRCLQMTSTGFIEIASAACGSGSGGSTTAVETPSGTINGSNAAFTVAYVPLWITINGLTYYENYGFTRSNGDLTIDSSLIPATNSVLRSVHNGVAVGVSGYLTDDSANVLTDDSANKLTPN